MLGMVCLSGLFFIFLYDGITQAAYFSLEEVRVTGLDRLSKDEVLKQAGIRQGDNSLLVNISLVKRRLISHGWIHDAAVKRQIPSTLSIAVKEEKPIAMVRIGKKKDLWMNVQGQPFKLYDPETDIVELVIPLVKGLRIEKLGAGYGFKGKLYDCIMDLLSIKGLNRLRCVTVDRDTGIELELHPAKENHPDSGNPIRVGMGFNSYDTKYKIAELIEAYIEKNASHKSVYAIDLFNRESVTVKVKNNDTLPDSQKGGA